MPYAHTFRSRPDLRPPTVKVGTPARDTAPGYIFATPAKGAGQYSPMVLDNQGEPVWFDYSKDRQVRDFRAQSYKGEPMLTWWEGEVNKIYGIGEYMMLDISYREIARLEAGNGYSGDLHEFKITPRDTALITIYNQARRDSSPLDGSKGIPVLEGIAQEIDLETGEVLFEWCSLDHVGVEESYSERPKKPWEAFDYLHINSIDVDHDENFLISARNTWAVYKIDRNSGEIMWRLGGKRSDFEMGPGTGMAFQHDARRQDDGTITIFDNGAAPDVHARSRNIVVELDLNEMKANLVREYTHPENLLAGYLGSMQTLPNGNVFAGWGEEPYFSEFGRNGKLLFDARFPQSTRLIARTDWSGKAIRVTNRPWSPSRALAKRRYSTPAGTAQRRSQTGRSLPAPDRTP